MTSAGDFNMKSEFVCVRSSKLRSLTCVRAALPGRCWSAAARAEHDSRGAATIPRRLDGRHQGSISSHEITLR